jgi:hypothetical protein
MSEFKDNQDELNRVKSMMSAVDIDSRVIPQPRLVENYMLDKVMSKILWQPNGLETVLSIMQKTEIDFNKYKNSFLYKWLLPGPLRLIKLVSQRFNQNPITKDLFNYLYDDKFELALCRTAYISNLTFFILSLTSIAGAFYFKSPWILLTFIIWFGCLFWQLSIFEHTMKYIIFIKIYEQFMDVIENHYDRHVAYVQRIFEIPQQIEEKWQQTQQQMIEDGMSEDEIRNRRSLGLKTSELLQQLGGAIALQQAKDDAEIQKIVDGTKLQYLQAELKIKKEELHDPDRQHELLISSVNAMGQFLVERSKALAADDQEQRNINYQLSLLDGIRNGNASPEYISEVFSKIADMESNPISTDDVS